MTVANWTRRRTVVTLAALPIAGRSFAQSGTLSSADISGVLVIGPSYSISNIDDIGQGDRICGGLGGSILIADLIAERGINYYNVPSTELAMAMQTGACNAAVIVGLSQEDAFLFAERLFSKLGFLIVPITQN